MRCAAAHTVYLRLDQSDMPVEGESGRGAAIGDGDASAAYGVEAGTHRVGVRARSTRTGYSFSGGERNGYHANCGRPRTRKKQL